MTATTIYLHGFSGDDEGLREFAEAMDVRPYHLLLMPGFGGTSVRREARDDLREYGHDVMKLIDGVTLGESFHLVGHSHGAIVAYVVAVLFPERVATLTLINPVARPRWASRMLSAAIRGASWVVPNAVFLRILRNRTMVDAVSDYLAGDHDEIGLTKVKDTRRGETKHYHKDMFRLSRHAASFQEFMKESRVECPTTILYDEHDNVAGSKDVTWYTSHLNNPRVIKISGGHLGVVAVPEDIAKQLRDTSR